MVSKIRSSGIKILGEIPWGTHFCHFYETKEDLLDILVPYFKMGLENNEYCIWVTSEPLTHEMVVNAMIKAIPNFKKYLKKKQIEIVPYTEGYLKNNVLDLERVLNDWVDKLKDALSKGFDGLRVTGNIAWLEKIDWDNFTEYEEQINTVISDYQMMVICTYQLDKCGPREILDVIQNHQFALVKRKKEWKLFKSVEQIRVEQKLKESEKKLLDLIESIPIGISISNTEGEIIECNTAAYKIPGFDSKHDLLNSTASDHYYDLKDRERFIKLHKKGLVKNFEARLKQKDGTIYWSSITSAEQKVGKLTQFFNTFQDITERKKIEKKLIDSERNLNERVKELTCLYGISKLVEDPENSVKNIIQGTVDLIPPALQFPEITSARITLDKNEYKTKNLRETKFRLSSSTKVNGEDLNIEVFYIEDKPFLTEDENLVVEIGKRLKRIIEEEKTEQKIKESVEKFHDLYEEAPIAYFSIGSNQSIKRVNKAGAKLLDYSKEELLGLKVLDLYANTEEGLEKAKEVFKQFIEGEKIQNEELQMKKKNGEFIWVELTVNPVFDKTGDIIESRSVVVDITEHKKAEQKVRESEQELKELIEAIPVGITITSLEGDTLECNSAAFELFGYDLKEEFLKVPVITHYYNPEDRKKFINLHQKGVVKDFEVQFKRKDETKFWVSITSIAQTTGKETRFINTFQDITERKEAEKKITESEERYRHLANELELIFDHIPAVIAYKDTENNFLRINKFMADGQNLKKEDMEGKSAFEFYPHNEAQKYWEDDLEVIKSKKPKLNFIEPWETPEGKRWANTSKIPYIDEGGNVKGIIALAINVTDRIEAEQRLKESEKKLRDLIKNIPGMIYRGRPDWSIEIITGGVDIYGYSSEEFNLQEVKWLDLIHPDDRERIVEEASKLVNNPINLIQEYRIIAKDKRTLWVEDHKSSYFDEEGIFKGVDGVVFDITSRKEIEQKLRESEEKYHSIYDASPDYIYLTDIEGNLQDANKALIDKMGITLEDLRSSNFIDYYAGDDTEDLLNKFARILSGEKIKDIEIIAKSTRGEIFIYEVNAVPIREGGKVISVLNLARDITERKISEEKISDLAKFPSENPNPILRVSREFVIFINEVGQKLFNIESGDRIPILFRDRIDQVFTKNAQEELEIELNSRFYIITITPIKGTSYANIYGRDITERRMAEEQISKLAKFPSENPNPVLRVRKDRIIYSNKVGETVFKVKEGDKVPEFLKHKLFEALDKNTIIKNEIKLDSRIYAIDITPIKEWGYVNVYGRDITERKEYEGKLKESEKDYRIAFDRASFYKDLVVHDINNILNIIVSDVQLYSLYQKNPDKSKDPNTLIKRIGEAGYRGVRLVSNIQKLSNLEEVEKSKEIVDVFKVLNGAVNFIKKTYREKEVNIKLELYSKKAKVIADELILDVFENIITNAVKYNDNIPIEILIKSSLVKRKGKNFIKIEFLDNGIGIPDKRKAIIFQRGYEKEKQTKGMGFGLSLVKKIIDNYEGEIWVENNIKGDYTKGSNFILLIPEVM